MLPAEIRSKVLAINDHKRISIDVPEWGVTVYASTLTGRRQIEMAAAQAAYPKDDQAVRNACFVIFHIQAEDGSQVFSSDDAPALAEKNSGVIGALQRKILGMYPDLETSVKN